MGGIGTLLGPIVGAAFFLGLREFFSRVFPYLAAAFNLPQIAEFPYLIPVGVIFIAMVIFLPQGLLGFMRRWLNE
jgi:ABC-type branched-subunit amino acid transport system permease subunit